MAGEKLNLNALFVPFVVRCSSRVVFVFLLLLLGLGCLLKQGLLDDGCCMENHKRPDFRLMNANLAFFERRLDASLFFFVFFVFCV